MGLPRPLGTPGMARNSQIRRGFRTAGPCNIITSAPRDRRRIMRRVKLDRIDRRILHDLQAKGRMTNVEWAKRAGISAPPCLRRVRALEKAGVIRGYHADENPEQLGFGGTGFAR